MITVDMFQGNMFRLNMFFLFVHCFKHVSCMAVHFGFAARCCMLVTVAIKVCGNFLPSILLNFYPSPIIVVVFLNRSIFQLEIWPHNGPNFGSFRHPPPFRIYPPF